MRQPALAMKRILLPVSYWRSREFSFVLNNLPTLQDSTKILDLGSPKTVSLILARKDNAVVCTTDIRFGPVQEIRRFASAPGKSSANNGVVLGSVEDGRSLPHSDDTFDAAFAVSVLEHIPNDGDSAAVSEMARVVRPGGLILITVPYAGRFHETWVDKPVYEREQLGNEAVFFQRHYDLSRLERRLVGPSGCELVRRELWGEPVIPVESLLGRLGKVSLVMSPLEAFLAAAFLRPVKPNDHAAMAAFLVLKVPG